MKRLALPAPAPRLLLMFRSPERRGIQEIAEFIENNLRFSNCKWQENFRYLRVDYRNLIHR